MTEILDSTLLLCKLEASEAMLSRKARRAAGRSDSDLVAPTLESVRAMFLSKAAAPKFRWLGLRPTDSDRLNMLVASVDGRSRSLSKIGA